MFSSPDFPLEFVKLEARHFAALEVQESQRWQYGMDVAAITPEEAEQYAALPNSWAVTNGDCVLAILGVNETFAGVQGVAFALLGQAIGRAQHRITRFARDVVIAQSGLQRVEAIVRCADPPPALFGEPHLMLEHCLVHATPQVRWAVSVGFAPSAVLRKFGLASETHMLLERIA